MGLALTDIGGWQIVLLDALIEQIDAHTTRHVECIREAGLRLGIDPCRVEADVDRFVQRFESERSWYLRQRHALAAGIVGSMLDIEPPQV